MKTGSMQRKLYDCNVINTAMSKERPITISFHYRLMATETNGRLPK